MLQIYRTEVSIELGIRSLREPVHINLEDACSMRKIIGTALGVNRIVIHITLKTSLSKNKKIA